MDGVLIIDKPAGITSHDVVSRVRRILGERRVGHTGTLDPFATGVLVLLIGQATRLARFLTTGDKEYEAILRFGFSTDTADSTGQPMLVADPMAVKLLSEKKVESAMMSFKGEIEQVPPMYSAKKIRGKKLYEYAREGIMVPRDPVKVVVHELEALKTARPLLTETVEGTRDLAFRVRCGPGTYIRALAESIGDEIGVPAHLAVLRRTRDGQFGIEKAISLADLEIQATQHSAWLNLMSPDAALSHLPFLHLSAEDARRACNGAGIRPDYAFTNLRDGALVRMRGAAEGLVAIGAYDARSGEVRPRVVLASKR